MHFRHFFDGNGVTTPIRRLRVEMVLQTSTFLSWALKEDRDLPRIPRLRSDEGGFDRLMSQPGGRRVATMWWSQALGVELRDE